MRLALRIAIAGALLAAPVMAQSPNEWQPKQQQMRDGFSQQVTTTDLPLGAPYRTGESGSGQSQVPLRDFLSTRIDQQRTETIAIIDRLERQIRDLIDERDRQYDQRFEGQQKATADSLQATKETSANALAAAKEATTKAEDSINERLKLSNELRGALEDVGRLQLPRAEAEARFKTLEEKTAEILIRLNNITSNKEGAANLWGYIIGAIGVFLAIASWMKPIRQSSARSTN